MPQLRSKKGQLNNTLMSNTRKAYPLLRPRKMQLSTLISNVRKAYAKDVAKSKARKIAKSNTKNVAKSNAKKIAKTMDSDDTCCETEGPPKSTFSLPQKPPGVKQTQKSRESCNTRKSITNSDGKMEKKTIGTPSPQVTMDAQGCIVLDESSLVVERPAQSEAAVISQDPKKRKIRQWSSEDTKKFYTSLGCVQTDFTLMSQLFNHTRTRRELKLKFKREERKNRDLVDKVLASSTGRMNTGFGGEFAKFICGVSVDQNSDKKENDVGKPFIRPHAKQVNSGATCRVNTGFNAEFVSSVSMDQNSGKKNECTSGGEKISVEGSFSVEKPFFKPRAKVVKRIRKFYFETDSDEEDVSVISKKNSGHTTSKKVNKQCSSSLPQLPSPNIVLPKSPTSAADNSISIIGVNIRHPTVLRIGKNGERQTFDARVVLNNNTEGKYLRNTEVLPQGISSSSLQTGLVQKKTSISCERTSKDMHHKILPEKCHSKAHDIQHKVLQGKCSNAHGRLDVVQLLLGDLKGVDVVHVGNETIVFPGDKSDVLKAQKNDSRSKRGTSSEIDRKESEVEVVFENVSSPSKEAQCGLCTV